MKYGVIDIGTRATRLLIGDSSDLLKYGFRFKDYKNYGDITEAGNGIQSDGNNGYFLMIRHLEPTVQYLLKLIDEASENGIPPENIYAVGTEVFRRVSNWREIVTIIKNITGIHLQVLDPVEEAETTFWAARISCAPLYSYNVPFVVIEQGGGSTQITVASVDEGGNVSRYGQISIPKLGTLLLKEQFIKQQHLGKGGGDRLVRTVKRDMIKYASQAITNSLSSFSLSFDQIPNQAFALGTVITNTFRKMSNAKVHGKEAALSYLMKDPTKDSILGRYSNYTVRKLIEDAENGLMTEDLKTVEARLIEAFGLPCYAAVLQYFGIEKLRVCGTGLRYGVFFRLANEEWKNIREFQS